MVKQIPLGKTTIYKTQYDASLLFPIPRKEKRKEIGIRHTLPFTGVDIWNAYEMTWLNPQGKPEVAIATITIPCQSSHLIESKSLKLYLISFHNTVFDSMTDIENTITKDLNSALNTTVDVCLKPLQATSLDLADGYCLDQLDVTIDSNRITPNLLTTDIEHVSECVYSDLLKSNCLVTGQPDWGSVSITYSGKQINHQNLLKYIISFRNHNEFHEQCVERIFMDIMQQCHPQSLTVYARYTRRGGIDINPIRSTESDLTFTNQRLFRQ